MDILAALSPWWRTAIFFYLIGGLGSTVSFLWERRPDTWKAPKWDWWWGNPLKPSKKWRWWHQFCFWRARPGPDQEWWRELSFCCALALLWLPIRILYYLDGYRIWALRRLFKQRVRRLMPKGKCAMPSWWTGLFIRRRR